MKCDLVIIFNHQYEGNIPLLESYYQGRFNHIWHLSPFSRGKEKNIISVHDGSFTFQSFVAQAWRTLRESNADYYLFVSDDLLLDPQIHQGNIREHLSLQQDGAFISQLIDLSSGEFNRGLLEVKRMRRQELHGLEYQQQLPDPGTARQLIRRHVPLRSERIRSYHPYGARYTRPLLENLGRNWQKFKDNTWHRKEQVRHFLRPVTMPYPVIGGNADIFAVPASRMDEFAHLCGVFAAMRVFVELAIPTALAMSCEHISTEKTTRRKGLNYAAIWKESEILKRRAVLDAVESATGCQLDLLQDHWPASYLYLHPLKLSNWRLHPMP